MFKTRRVLGKEILYFKTDSFYVLQNIDQEEKNL